VLAAGLGFLLAAFTSSGAFAGQGGSLGALDSYEAFNIFEPDSREDARVARLPYSRIAQLTMERNGRTSRCTGSLVGPKLLLTNAHCIESIVEQGSSGFRQVGTLLAQFGRFERRYLAQARGTVLAYGRDSSSDRGRDWALVELDEAIGLLFGYFPVSLEMGERGDADLDQEDLWLAGYSGDWSNGRRQSVHPRCSAREFRQGKRLIFHDCDSSRGASGSPVLRCSGEAGACRIVALHAAEYRSGSSRSLTIEEYAARYANIAIHPSNFITVLERYLKVQKDQLRTRPTP
jgi:V8-like Glu-specific endopeptidase